MDLIPHCLQGANAGWWGENNHRRHSPVGVISDSFFNGSLRTFYILQWGIA
ncbi:MAG: hypothetical protein WBA93_22895 [Microcoleaceae cyanobacterium]